MKILSTKTTYTCPILKVEEREMELENGQHETWWVVVRQPYVGVVAVTTDQKVVMIKEQRAASDTLNLDFPGGKTDKFDMSESELINQAKTELAEETGYRAENLELLFKDKIARNWYERDTFYYLATDVEKGVTNPGPAEKIEVVLLSFSELREQLPALAKHLQSVVGKLFEHFGESLQPSK